MVEALYRKYRPQKFSEVVGQDHIKTTLLNELQNNQLTHAYLFCGARGIGKTTLARLLAKGANCLKSHQGEPCNKCANCEMIINNQALDIIEIDAASHTGVDNVRQNIIQQSRVVPSKLKYKVFIIDEVHMLSLSAFNALLKTLEEPPAQTIFVLATTEAHKVPATIISRCQRFDFKKIPFNKMVEKLQRISAKEGRQIDLAVLERIAQHSEGCLRDAESLLSQVLSLNEEVITAAVAELVMPYSDLQLVVDFWQALAQKQATQALAQVNQLVEQGIDLQDFTQRLLEFLRKIMLYKINGRLEELDYLDIDQKAHQQIRDILEKLTVGELQKMVQVFMEQLQDLKSSPIVQLPLELGIVEICYRHPQPLKKNFEKAVTSTISHTNNINETAKKDAANVNSTNLFYTIQKKWPEFLKEMKKVNHSLALTLGIAHLVKLEDDKKLILGFKYKFHQDRLMDLVNCEQIERELQRFFGQAISLGCVIDEKYEVKNGDNLTQPSDEGIENVWDLAVNTFGSDE